MKIIKFTAENIKKLKAVEITPQGNLVEVTGPNGQGKSSVLDAIYYALAGTGTIPSQVVRQGEEKALIRLDLGELIVTRRFTAAGGTTLVVEAQNGARFPSPQKMLDDLIGALSFDPLAFMRLKAREQVDALRQLVKVEGLDQVESGIVDLERDLSLDRGSLRNLEARLATTVGWPSDTPDEPVDVMALVQRLQDTNEANAKIKDDQAYRDQLALKIQDGLRNAAQKANTVTEIAAEAQRRIDAIIAQRDHTIGELQKIELELRQRAKENELKLKGLEPLPWPVDTQGIIQQIDESKAINASVDAKRRRRELEIEVVNKRSSVDQLSAQLTAERLKRKALITAQEMPIAELGFNESEVLLNGLPLANASSAEQLRVSVALAMAANPKLRVLRVKDGSLLDEGNLRLLGEMAAASDYQVWVERVEDSHGRPCVVMEDGSAKA